MNNLSSLSSFGIHFRFPHPSIEALAASSVKIAARDVLATWKVLISLGLAPLLYGFYAFLATVVMIKANAPLSWRIWTPLCVIVALPVVGFAALKFGEAGIDVLKSVFVSVSDANTHGTRFIDLCDHSSSLSRPDINGIWIN